MDIEVYKKQVDIAKRNGNRYVPTLEVGEFVFLDECTLKNEGFIQALFDAAEGCIHTNRLCQIESVAHCTEQELLENKFQFAPGGSRSDVFANDDELKNAPDYERYQYFYTLVTLIITDTGRYVFCDAEGYNHPRYLLLWKDWREMFAEEISREEIRREEFRMKRQKEEEEKRARQKTEQKKEISERWGFLDPSKSIKGNWIAACKVFFKFPVKVSKSSDYYGKIRITLICRSTEEREMVAKMVKKAQDDFNYYTGERGIGNDGYEYAVYRNRLEDHVPGFLYDVTADLEY